MISFRLSASKLPNYECNEKNFRYPTYKPLRRDRMATYIDQEQTREHFRDGEISELALAAASSTRQPSKEASELNGIAQVCLVQELVPSE
jgi:hypothetical protein